MRLLFFLKDAACYSHQVSQHEHMRKWVCEFLYITIQIYTLYLLIFTTKRPVLVKYHIMDFAVVSLYIRSISLHIRPFTELLSNPAGPSVRLLLLTKDHSLFHGRSERLGGRDGSGDDVQCGRALWSWKWRTDWNEERRGHIEGLGGVACLWNTSSSLVRTAK